MPAPPESAEERKPTAGALDGVRVVDMTSIAMGPMATQILGDMGADVIKVESPEGDPFRAIGPTRSPGMGHAFLNLNRNKRSVVLDAGSDAGKRHLRDLISWADVFVSNLRHGSLSRLELDADALTARHPRLIHCACYGYSEAGPYAGRAAIDDTIQAESGLAWLQGLTNGGNSEFVNTIVADKVVGLHVANAITSALYARTRTGRGQSIEVPMYECMVAFSATEHLGGLTYDPPQGGAGYSRLLQELRKPHRTADGYLCVVPYTGRQWARFFAIAGRSGLADDPRFSTPESRSDNIAELYEVVADAVIQRTTAHWGPLLIEADIPFAPVNSFPDLLEDAHLNATGFWQHLRHPTEGDLVQWKSPVTFSETPNSLRRLAPTLGEHSHEVLKAMTSDPKENPPSVAEVFHPPRYRHA